VARVDDSEDVLARDAAAMPVPVTLAGSMLLSASSRRTTGERTRESSLAAATEGALAGGW